MKRLRLLWALVYSALLLVGLAPDEWDCAVRPGHNTVAVVALQPDLDDLGEVARPSSARDSPGAWLEGAASSATTADMLYPSAPGSRFAAPVPIHVAIPVFAPAVPPCICQTVPLARPYRGPPPRTALRRLLPTRAPPFA